MKICWGNLDDFSIGKRRKELRKGHYTYIEKDSCKNCGESYLMNVYKPTEYCCVSCGKKGSDYFHSESTKRKIGKASEGNTFRKNKPMSYNAKLALAKIRKIQIGEKSTRWKGGIVKKNVPLYDTFAKQINWLDEVRSVYIDGLKLMEVKCTKCNKWFVPKATEVHERLKYLKGQKNSENRFYCSNKCKESCDIFHQSLWPKSKKPRKKWSFENINESDLKTWREEVLKRSDYLCEYCGEQAIIAHHIRPKKLEQFLALDPENGIACCKVCHNRYGHFGECSTWSLAHIKCKEERIWI